MIWWVSDINTRLQATEEAVDSFEATDTSTLQERLATLETQSSVISEVIQKMDGKIDDVESSISIWAEKEINKIYDILNKGNPLGQ
tara:strand:+ start:10062 stop:10319 length:258 start_codon:yes stop_codon:yes gene_type:complete